MSDSQALLSKIAALRMARDSSSPAAEELAESRLHQLERSVQSGGRQNALLADSLRTLISDRPTTLEQVRLPEHLTARAHRLLQRCRELISNLRSLSEPLMETFSQPGADDDNPLLSLYRETVAMAATVLRVAQTFPETPSTQLQLCDGLEAIQLVITDRTAALQAAIERRYDTDARIDALADHLIQLSQGEAQALAPYFALAQKIENEAADGAPLIFHSQACYVASVGPKSPLKSSDSKRAWVARFVAAHGLVVAQVAARIVRHAPELKQRTLDVIVAALLHDVGMLKVPAEILSQTNSLGDAERRIVEGHTRLGSALLAGSFPQETWLNEAALVHHERLDGTGYPGGLGQEQLDAFARLLTVCDVYAAMCSERPHRTALDPRTALADTLQLAAQGSLDRDQAERLLFLSFYPVGAMVELADGAVGVVVATHMGRRDQHTPARPVVALLTDGYHRPLPAPSHVDLSECQGRSIARVLSASESRQLIGKRYPHFAK